MCSNHSNVQYLNNSYSSVYTCNSDLVTVSSPCSSAPCMNGASCRENATSYNNLQYNCTCVPPFFGNECEGKLSTSYISQAEFLYAFYSYLFIAN